MKIIKILFVVIFTMSLISCYSENDNFTLTETYNIEKIVDNSLDCDTALEKIYEDESFEYYFPCIKGEWVEVIYSNGEKENVIDALENNHIEIADLIRFDIYYIQQEK